MTPIVALRVVDVARNIVEKVAPQQADEFDFVAREYSRAAARRARRPSNEPTASVNDIGQAVLTAVALGVTTDICEHLLTAAAKNAAKSTKGWLHRRFSKAKITLETEVPGLPAEQIERIRQRAEETAVEHGLPADQAKALAKALVQSWPGSQ